VLGLGGMDPRYRIFCLSGNITLSRRAATLLGKSWRASRTVRWKFIPPFLVDDDERPLYSPPPLSARA